MTLPAAQHLLRGLPVASITESPDRGFVEVVFPVALTDAARERVGHRVQEWRDGQWRMVDWRKR